MSEGVLNPLDPIGSAHVDGDFVDQLIWNALATAGPDGMPEDLLLAIPRDIRTRRYGLKGVRWISSAVLTTSDDAMGSWDPAELFHGLRACDQQTIKVLTMDRF